MPWLDRILNRTASPHTSTTEQINSYEGITSDGRVVLRDRRGTLRAEIPDVEAKGVTVGNNPLAIYRPAGAKTIDAARAMANFTGWTYAAVNAIGREVSGIQLRLYQVQGKDHKEIDDHDLLTLLDAVNPHMTGPELKYVTMSHLELAGNCYWFLDGANSATAKPTAIYPLNPGSVRVKLDQSSFPYKLSHYEYTLDTKVYTFQPHQILHIKYPDPNDPFVGIGIPQTIASWIDSDNYAMEYNRKFFINGANVGLYIETDTNVEGNLDRIRKSWSNRQEGTDNAHKTPVFPKGVKLEHTGLTQKDMDFDKLTTTTRDRILAAFGVSKTILGTAESDTNRATSETADYVFSRRVIKPKMLLVVSYLNEFLVPRYGDDLYLTFIDPTPEDKAARTTEMQAMVGSQPVMTINEARQNYAGLGPIKGGDQLMGPTAMEAVGTTDTPEGDDIAPGASADDGSPGKSMQAKTFTPEGWAAKAVRVRTGGKTVHSSAYAARRALSASFSKAIDRVPEFQVKSFNQLTHTDYMEHWKRFADRSGATEAQLRRIFEEINAKQKAEVLFNLPDATGVTKDLGELFDTKEWIGLTIDLVTPVLFALAKDEAASALAMIGAQQRDILHEEQTRRALEQGISQMSRSYNETTLAQLEKVLGDKLSQSGGTNLPELKEAVESVYEYADSRRAALIAKTESFRAANWANKEAWRASGMVKTLKWYTSEKDNVCEFCRALDGKEIGIDDNFFDLGDVVKGTDGGFLTLDYADVEAPPIHPDCACFIRPETIEA